MAYWETLSKTGTGGNLLGYDLLGTGQIKPVVS